MVISCHLFFTLWCIIIQGPAGSHFFSFSHRPVPQCHKSQKLKNYNPKKNLPEYTTFIQIRIAFFWQQTNPYTLKWNYWGRAFADLSVLQNTVSSAQMIFIFFVSRLLICKICKYLVYKMLINWPSNYQPFALQIGIKYSTIPDIFSSQKFHLWIGNNKRRLWQDACCNMEWNESLSVLSLKAIILLPENCAKWNFVQLSVHQVLHIWPLSCTTATSACAAAWQWMGDVLKIVNHVFFCARNGVGEGWGGSALKKSFLLL